MKRHEKTIFELQDKVNEIKDALQRLPSATPPTESAPIEHWRNVATVIGQSRTSLHNEFLDSFGQSAQD